MRTLNRRSGSSRQKRNASRIADRSTTAVGSPWWSWVSTIPGPKVEVSRSSMAWPSIGGERVRGPRLVALSPGRDFLLELHEAVDHAFGARREAGNVHIHGDDGVYPHDGGVVVVKAARAGADSEGHHPLGLAHLVVHALEHRGQLVADRAHHEQHVRLPGREAGQPRAAPVPVVVRAGGGHVFHAAARGDERILEDGGLAGPAEGLIELSREDT